MRLSHHLLMQPLCEQGADYGSIGSRASTVKHVGTISFYQSLESVVVKTKETPWSVDWPPLFLKR